jgi:hypothetical protein
MTIRSRNLLNASLRWIQVVAFALLGCSPDMSDDPIPYQPFPDIILNLALPENIALKSKGNAREINGGVRGIIVYCQDPGVYVAFERNCSYPRDACATVNIDNSKLFDRSLLRVIVRFFNRVAYRGRCLAPVAGIPNVLQWVRSHHNGSDCSVIATRNSWRH